MFEPTCTDIAPISVNAKYRKLKLVSGISITDSIDPYRTGITDAGKANARIAIINSLNPFGASIFCSIISFIIYYIHSLKQTKAFFNSMETPRK